MATLLVLTSQKDVVMMDNRKIESIYRNRETLSDGGFTEQVIWRVPQSVRSCPHPYKYRLAYIVDGDRVVGYDNECGNGDHRYFDGGKFIYTFRDSNTLLADFEADIARWNMDTVILEVSDPVSNRARFIRAWETGKLESAARIGFATPELMWQVLNENRRVILKAMTGVGPLALRELARRVRRDVKAVHTDTRVLLNAGVIDRTEDGKLLFPYRHVKMQFEFDAAA